MRGLHSGLEPLPSADRPGLFGPGAIDVLPEYAVSTNTERIALVTGKASFERSGAARAMRELERNAAVFRWSDFDPNPSAEDLRRGIAELDAFDPQLIVGIGGGSVMDMAKLLFGFAGSSNLAADLQTVLSHGFQAKRGDTRLVLVPTTAGSGSEATHFAVMYLDGVKHSVASPALYPDFVVLDPELASSASGYQKATSGIDATCQAMESIWAVGATEQSRYFAVQALERLIPALPAWVAGDKEVEDFIAAGSYLAGRAIDISKTTGPHAMSYGFTTQHGISHGHAVAITFGAFASMHAVAARSVELRVSLSKHREAMRTLTKAIGLSSPTELADWFTEFCASLGLDLGLTHRGISKDALTHLAKGVNVERLGNNPVILTQSDLQNILYASQ